MHLNLAPIKIYPHHYENYDSLKRNTYVDSSKTSGFEKNIYLYYAGYY